MKTPLLLRSIALFVLGLIAVSCTNYDKRLANSSTPYVGTNAPFGSQQAPSQPKLDAPYWDGDNISGSPRIILNLTRQTIAYYKGDQLVGKSHVSTGQEGFDTPTGNFKVIQKDPDHVSTLYGDFVDAAGNVVVPNVRVSAPKPAGTVFRGAPMPYFMRLQGAVGMHQGYTPGVPDSHGCIRIPKEIAQTFYNNTPLGTPVQIVR